MVQILVVAAVIFLFVWLLRPRPYFVIEIRDGVALVAHGKPPTEFVDDCERLAAEGNMDTGQIKGVKRLGRVELAFSREIGAIARQRLRNVWSFHI